MGQKMCFPTSFIHLITPQIYLVMCHEMIWEQEEKNYLTVCKVKVKIQMFMFFTLRLSRLIICLLVFVRFCFDFKFHIIVILPVNFRAVAADRLQTTADVFV